MFRRHSKDTTARSTALNGIMPYAVARVRCVYAMRLRSLVNRALSQCYREVSLNGIHIYGDTGMNTRSRFQGVCEQRKRERERQNEKEGWKGKDFVSARVHTHTYTHTCVHRRQASQISIAQFRLPPHAFWFSSPNDLATSEFCVGMQGARHRMRKGCTVWLRSYFPKKSFS